MFKTANALSGIERQTLPTELIPLNTLMLSRGLLNFTVLQSMRDWILPYWAEQQFNPLGASFIPRSHLGLSINVTNRNWTAIGTMECSEEPIVDPRGLVTPFRNEWSIDSWIAVGEATAFPSRIDSLVQRLVSGLPIVETVFGISGVECRLTSFVVGHLLIHRATVRNNSGVLRECRLAIAVRPFNPEGIALLQSVTYDETANSFTLDEHKTVHFSLAPTAVHCSTFRNGDSANHRAAQRMENPVHDVRCDVGLANAFAAFDVRLDPQASATVETTVPLSHEAAPVAQDPGPVGQVRYWEEILSRGVTLHTPDERVNSMVRASLATLLLLTDQDSITPGPATYHQFWFRDAAYMLWALDKFGFSSVTRPILASFATRQEKSGYFRSQQGEWDSNGQVLWTVWQHILFSHDTSVASELAVSLTRGERWIGKMRLPEGVTSPACGLLPSGLSAEHLGLADHYFWDNFWSAAGLEAYLQMCDALKWTEQRGAASRTLASLMKAVERAIERAQRDHSISAIPASPFRGVDSGMIGSCCAWYPLQLLPVHDKRMIGTLDTLQREFFVDGMFYQNFIHSGLNAYLTLHVAHAHLYAGNREIFNTILQSVLSRASTTCNFPEAIHPQTGGGSMGDGHHGWAAAEILLAMRDSLVYEKWESGGAAHSLELLTGVPPEWFLSGKEFGIANAPVPEGSLTLLVTPISGGFSVALTYRGGGIRPPGVWRLHIPFSVGKMVPREGHVEKTSDYRNATIIEVAAGSTRIDMTIRT